MPIQGGRVCKEFVLIKGGPYMKIVKGHQNIGNLSMQVNSKKILVTNNQKVINTIEEKTQ